MGQCSQLVNEPVLNRSPEKRADLAQHELAGREVHATLSDPHLTVGLECDLEQVTFDDVAMPSQPIPVEEANVTTTRGSLSTIPFHHEALSAETRQVVDEFVSSVCRTPPPMALETPPPRRRARTPPQEATNGPRRSTCLATLERTRVSNAVMQAQNMLMKKLGLAPPDQPPTTEAFIQYTTTFNKPLSTAHREAIRSLFAKRVRRSRRLQPRERSTHEETCTRNWSLK